MVASTTRDHSEDATPAPLAGGLEFVCEPRGKLRKSVTARLGKDTIHNDVFDVESSAPRKKFINFVFTKMKESRLPIPDFQLIEQTLIKTSRAVDECETDRVDGMGRYLMKDDEDPGIYRESSEGTVRLTNFTMRIERGVMLHDASEDSARFEGTIKLGGKSFPFTMSAGEFAQDPKLREKLYSVGGAGVRIHCSINTLRDAVSSLSHYEHVKRTTDFGWSPEGDSYRCPAGVVDRDGFRPYVEEEVRVDLGEVTGARQLNLRKPLKKWLPDTRQHIVTDLFPLHDRALTYSLLATVALATLFRFVEGRNRFALWITGRTGEGKSFVAKLFQNFFGDFPLEEGGNFGSWTSTGNFLQQQGYAYKDAFYLVDDYKPANVRHPEVIRLLQNYADGSARGRLNADSSTKATRPIRGFLVSTGEDLPEHSSSALARSIVVRVPVRPKDLERGERCLEFRERYRGVMADFLRWLIVEDQTSGFAERVEIHQKIYYRGLENQENGLRIATNLALLAAGFAVFAEYLSDIWPQAEAETRRFEEVILPRIRDEMLETVQSQQASEIFLTTTAHLVAAGKVRIDQWSTDAPDSHTKSSPLIGKMEQSVPLQHTGSSKKSGEIVEISIKLAMAEVQNSLADQRKPLLAITEAALLDQFVTRGVLFDSSGKKISDQHQGDRTFNRRLGGTQIKLARILASALGK